MADERLETDELRDFRLRARSWLADHARPSGGRLITDAEAAKRLDEFRQLQQALLEAGFAGFTFPVDLGGQGLTVEHELVFGEEAADYEMPPTPFRVSINIIAAALCEFATTDQQRAYVPDILTGKKIWVQLLSEPSGGSDLAGLLTNASRDGETFVVNGQKVWTTSGHLADFALCPVRTRWDVPKHRGISMLIVDLRSPGVEIGQITQIDRGAGFCHEFLTDVVVPVSNLVGAENDGWRVARGLLEIEHAWVGRGGAVRLGEEGTGALALLAEAKGVDGDSGVGRRIVAHEVDHVAQKLMAGRISSAMGAGRLPASFGGILKLGDDLLGQRRAELAFSLAGGGGVSWTMGQANEAHWSDLFLESRQLTIAGGTTEMQRNNISEHALGLPREPAVDRDVAFHDVPHN